ncbi:hypothetical protein ACIPL5_004296 [Escherichia coli]
MQICIFSSLVYFLANAPELGPLSSLLKVELPESSQTEALHLAA